MKWLIYVVFIIMYLLVTFFGLGPVLFADGSNSERIITLVIVVVIYIILSVSLKLLIKKTSR
ncbi:hypothetical protein K9O30_06465 [Clostridium bowmanii]|uniref:DUF6954 family protein n=1 Tax=Clostridium bowmanii TaxID=132925 RepID=UPI001C0E2CA3|nr:hypothetical protein [Clostridium bowmanii]MBU3188803.1 hypothetical protein [Clostridium bowmanii]MCA1073386.1 hypothetical protein [Clostridium bowmanii]